MEQTTDKQTALILTSLCVQHGVENVVLSPGSRNAPLIIAFNREKQINCQVIVDERSAAFFALGMAQKSGKPVAIVCTSGTALLNYAPAVAEAYYQQIPLMVISADRPPEWIDQEDSQTIRQHDALRNIVKQSYTLPAEIHNEEERRYVNRIVNDAFRTALSGYKAPVHINIPFREPLYQTTGYTSTEKVITYTGADKLSEEALYTLSGQFNNSRKIMILAGFMHHTDALRKQLEILSHFPNVIIVSEPIANVPLPESITLPEIFFTPSEEKEEEAICPDLLITMGGAIVSKATKQYLRKNPIGSHWNINRHEYTIDTFQCLTHQINIDAETFFTQLTPLVQSLATDYRSVCLHRQKELLKKQQQDLQQPEWNIRKAFSIIMPAIPSQSDVHLSNGLSVRLGQQYTADPTVTFYANRGTSGIDGSTSTAAGAAYLHNGITTLISGDLSFLYDSNALWNNYLSPGLKMIVINNGHGGIFREIQGGVCDKNIQNCLETPHQIEFKKLAALYNLRYLCASDESSLYSALADMYAENKIPVLLEITNI